MVPAASLLAHVSRPLELVREYEGGQGRTLHVCTPDDDQLVLKVLAIGEPCTEAAIAASVLHPAIPTVHEVGHLPDGSGYILRDHVAGDVLQSLPREPDALRELLQQLLEVIAFVHLRGVLHLDLKPGNLVVDGNGRLHLLDFGLAVRTGAGPDGGTPFFASPEVLFGALPDARSDLFSIGAMAVHASLPPTQLDIAKAARSFPTHPFLEACEFDASQLHPQLQSLIKGCVARQPSDRFPDASTALDALCGTGSGRPPFALLAPDPIQLFAPEWQEAATSERDVRVTGAGPEDRHAIAVQLAVILSNVRAVTSDDRDVVVQRSGMSYLTISLPDLTAERLAPHLETALGLEGAARLQAAQWLLARAKTSAAIRQLFRELVDQGKLLPVGTRWTWPAALTGRLEAGDETGPEDHQPREERIRVATRQGLIERAMSLWRGASGSEEETARAALAESLLDAGEAVRALPICSRMPVLRAQALVDIGQFAQAAEELQPLGQPASPRHRRVAAKMAMVRGEFDRAQGLLEGHDQNLLDHMLLAAVLVESDKLEASEALVSGCLSQLSCDEHPYAGASLHTSLGHVHRRRGELDAARYHYEAAVELAQRIGHVRHAAISNLNLGVSAKDAGAHGEAADRFREALALFEHIGDQGHAAMTKANLGIAALARNDLTTATTTLQEASTQLLRLGDTSAARLALVMLAQASVRSGDLAGAESALGLVGPPDTARLREEVAVVRQEMARGGDSGNDDDMPQDREQQPSRELFRTFLAVNRKLAQTVDLDQAMAALLDAAVTLTGGRSGYLLVLRSDGIRREFESGQAASHAHAYSRSLANQSVQEQRTLTGLDVLANEELQAMQSVRNLRVRSAICAPFHSAAGTKGAIYIEHPGRAGVFSDYDKEALEVLADQAAIAVDRMLREETMRTELSNSVRDLAVAKRATRRTPTRLLGDSKSMVVLRSEIDKLANLELSVLIQGETGTGKELVARALHERGQRKSGPFIAENCSALPAELMERELFGHVEGAFTGADRDRPGLLELANGGTLFLDEVGDMPAALQVKLLRALQERTIRRVGGEHTIDLDIRMVAATHRNLREMIAAEQFREDLFFRLAAVELRVPPLRERNGDVEQLAHHFVATNAKETASSLRLSASAIAELTSYPWPGNVRELEHVIARAALLCEGEEIVQLQLPTDRGAATPEQNAAPDVVLTLKEAERRTIAAAMNHHGGDKTKAAKILGISRTALYDKLKRHGLS